MNLGALWTPQGSELIDGETFNVFVVGSAVLKVSADVATETSVRLSATGTLEVLRTGQDTIVRERDGADVFAAPLDILTSLQIEGSDDDDMLSVDFSGGNPIPVGGLTFAGMGQANGDSLEVIGGVVDTIEHTFTSANDGEIDIELRATTSTIAYTGLEPITDNPDAAVRVFTFGETVDAITLADDGIAGNGISRISSVSSSETVDFVSPTDSLTINAGGGNDAINLSSVDSLFSASLAVNGDMGRDDTDASSLNLAITLSGGAGDDSIVGGGGNDLLTGAGGDDTLQGQAGNDCILGGAGDDKLLGNEGADAIDGNGGFDKLFGGTGDGSLRGGTRDDTLDGEAGHDTLIGGAGFDRLFGSAGHDLLRGGTGDDTLEGEAGSDTLEGGEIHLVRERKFALFDES